MTFAGVNHGKLQDGWWYRDKGISYSSFHHPINDQTAQGILSTSVYFWCCQSQEAWVDTTNRTPKFTLFTWAWPVSFHYSVMNPTFSGPGSARSSTAYETMDHRVAAVYENCVRLFPRFPVRARNDGV